jgi:hypothetical protein
MAVVRTSGTKMKFISGDTFTNAFKDFFERAQVGIADYEKKLLIALNEKILARTPVWEGDTIHNWRWSTRAPDLRHEDPVDNGDPGHTNSMPLGVEPRRAANRTRARQSLMGALRAREPVDIYLTNTADSAVGLEYGLLPTRDHSRSPAGMVRIAVKEVLEGIF